MMPLLAALLVWAAVPAHAFAAEPLGRLFLTPERRATLERQRREGLLDAAAGAGETISLDGTLTRSGGATTIWINGSPRHAAAFAGSRASAPSVRSHRATVGADVPPSRLRVGESVNRATGARTDVIAPGAIRIGRPRAGD